MDSWLVPATSVSVVEGIKKSRFIALFARTGGVEVAKMSIESAKVEHPDAHYHRVTWMAGTPNDPQRLGFSDDDEPAGMAGRPMPVQLVGSDASEVTAIVMRYYGDTLLGIGGLVKAYGGGVDQALCQLTIQHKAPLTEYTLQCEYGQLAGIEVSLGQPDGKVVANDRQAIVRLRAALPPIKVDESSARSADFSRGSLQLLATKE